MRHGPDQELATRHIAWRRKLIFGLSSLVTLAFLGLLISITLSPDTLIGGHVIVVGFALIVASIVITACYQLYVDRAHRNLRQSGDPE